VTPTPPRATATEPPAPTATLPIPTREELAASLVGQSFRFCRDRGIAFEGVIERSIIVDHELGGLRVEVVARTTNVGARPFGTFQLTELQDERNRRFDQAGISENVSGLDIAQKYGVEFHGRAISPGFTARHAWAFVVAPDVRQLTVVENHLFPCGPEELAPPPEDDGLSIGPAASLVGQGFTFCRGEPRSFELEIERAQATPAPAGLQIAVVVRATNLGRLPGGTARLTDVVDERGRRFAQAGRERGIDMGILARGFGAAEPNTLIQPGESGRQVWAYLVPMDVQRLTLVERELFSRCQR
jgi:hypothetical protein